MQQDNEADNAACQLVHPNQCHGYPLQKNNEREISEVLLRLITY